jgi:hypothetical protein
MKFKVESVLKNTPAASFPVKKNSSINLPLQRQILIDLKIVVSAQHQ